MKFEQRISNLLLRKFNYQQRNSLLTPSFRLPFFHESLVACFNYFIFASKFSLKFPAKCVEWITKLEAFKALFLGKFPPKAPLTANFIQFPPNRHRLPSNRPTIALPNKPSAIFQTQIQICSNNQSVSKNIQPRKKNGKSSINIGDNDESWIKENDLCESGILTVQFIRFLVMISLIMNFSFSQPRQRARRASWASPRFIILGEEEREERKGFARTYWFFCCHSLLIFIVIHIINPFCW